MTEDWNGWKPIFSLFKEGGGLSAEEALNLERRVHESPADLDARAKLTGYYEQQWMDGAADRCNAFRGHETESFGLPDGYFTHALYFIENVPESEYVRICAHSIHQKLNPEGYEKAREIWMRHLESDGDNAKLLWNAGRFFMIEEPSIAEKLLLRGTQLEPENPYWPERLSHFYSLSRRSDQEGASAKALAELEAAIALKAEDVDGKDFGEAALRAFAASDFEKAETYANRAIETATGEDRSPALHNGHTVLGRLAVREGDLAKAGEYLLASGDVERYPTLSSFGPTMVLAKELLEAGEPDVVLEYFQRCAKFWDYGLSRLDEWADVVRAGRVPEFGPSLRY